MAVIGCRIAEIGPVPVSAIGTILNKSTATIGQMANASTDMRVLQNLVNAPNSAGYPTIEQYILLEATQGYKVAVINQSWIITYNA